jgi:hypothetical protein
MYEKSAPGSDLIYFYQVRIFRPKHISLIEFSYFFVQAWGLCYDHNFLRFLTIFGENIGVFLKNQCYDQIFA